MRVTLPPAARSLSARLLILTIAFVMICEVLIYVPSVSRFRMSWLEERIAAAHLATLAVEATPDRMVGDELRSELLAHVGAHAIILRRPEASLLALSPGMPPEIEATVDLRDPPVTALIADAFVALGQTDNRILRVLGPSPRDPEITVEVALDEAPLRLAMWQFSKRILGLSLIISLVTAALVFLALQWLMVAPMRRLTQALVAFRNNPESAPVASPGSARGDEIGIAERELAHMQEGLRQALHQKDRLAALGTAVTKINHDLRNILSTARLVSDRLADSRDPQVVRHAPTLVQAIDRAVDLCSQTLRFAREQPAALTPSRFALAVLTEEAIAAAAATDDTGIRWRNDVPADRQVVADRDQMFRTLTNLLRNAAEAGARHIQIQATEADGLVRIDVADDGPGLPPKARDNLFQPFAGSARPGGTGLGLAIAREVALAHGGSLELVSSTASGTMFRLTLPAAGAGPVIVADAQRREAGGLTGRG